MITLKTKLSFLKQSHDIYMKKPHDSFANIDMKMGMIYHTGEHTWAWGGDWSPPPRPKL